MLATTKDLPVCPKCKGEKKLVTKGKGGVEIVVPCYSCNATGKKFLKKK